MAEPISAPEFAMPPAGGRLIGTVTTNDNGREEIKDAGGRPLGSFGPRTNQTKDRTGRVVSHENSLVVFVVRPCL
jgi:hypothetical protein